MESKFHAMAEKKRVFVIFAEGSFLPESSSHYEIINYSLPCYKNNSCLWCLGLSHC